MKQETLNHDADDPIVAEVREIRRQLLRNHGGFESFMQYIRERDAQRLQCEKEEADRRAAELGKSAKTSATPVPVR
jgi:hypothetical protein